MRQPRLLLLMAALAAPGCTQEPDVVARLAETSSLQDAGPEDAGASGADLDAGDPLFFDAGCNLEEALAHANLPPEALIVAATCRLPLSWLSTRGTRPGSTDALLEFIEANGPIEPQGESSGASLCDQGFGIWYLDNWARPTTIIVCQSACDWVKEQVNNSIGDLGCMVGGSEADAG